MECLYHHVDYDYDYGYYFCLLPGRIFRGSGRKTTNPNVAGRQCQSIVFTIHYYFLLQKIEASMMRQRNPDGTIISAALEERKDVSWRKRRVGEVFLMKRGAART